MTDGPLLRCHVLDTGYCLASEHHVLRGAPRRRMECHALVALLHHPEHGWTLFDTGYAPRVLDATRRWPYRLYRVATPLRIPAAGAVVDQLPALGVARDEVRRIVLSHFHADHVGGLRDFPAAGIVALREAYDDVAGRSGFGALRRAFLPDLLPADFAQRTALLPEPSGAPLPGLGPTHDLFGDGSLLLARLPGHARGQLGMLARTEGGPVLFAADGAYTARSIRERRPPSRVTRLFVDDFREVEATLGRLHEFAAARPEVRIVPTHCPEALEREVRR
ncbi:MAG: MBL fold metallo-hydrolase [Gemmatimonadetes bacterium]|nr:MBL fold metallo-hydrolase [Gemmatimonadota bacterium]